MSRFGRLYDSTIGKKFLVALTGLILIGFLLGHVTGNLKVFTLPARCCSTARNCSTAMKATCGGCAATILR